MTDASLYKIIEEALPIKIGHPQAGPAWNVSDWLTGNADADIKSIQSVQNASKMMTAGSLAIKRTAHTVIAALLAYYKEGVQWDLSESNVIIAHEKEAPLCLRVYLNHTVSYAERMDQSAFMRRLYFDWCKPLILSVSAVSNVNKLVLWENIYIYIRSFYLKTAPQLEGLVQLDWQKELDELTHEDFFGIDEPNPFHHLHHFKAKRVMEDGSRVRSTCCYKVQLPGGKNCKTCCQLKA
ncbi:hypothetical protein [Jeotgalibacillus sp. R-1-5s-1]|uniref:hypothetical protein n=1 Tax=Jeotgalibacillus sp. R-1-5s-1 TaxID=2555897 RepID=UPI00106CC5F4|nr:hypothetical protein [Jeotgalibacillus sp. R-1-5s-1]TFE02495.1 hypothetical protein E2491_02840 [Jeotgalibacillus sp. R-1-5s-1]